MCRHHHGTDEATGTPGGGVTGPRSHSWFMARPGLLLFPRYRDFQMFWGQKDTCLELT